MSANPKQTGESHHHRIERYQSTQPVPSLQEMISRARQYIDDRLWMPPAELKATIRRLSDELELRLGSAPPKPGDVEKAVPAPPKRQEFAPTHAGTVLGLKGRQDYDATLALVDGPQWVDQSGRRFNPNDYGYDDAETYRLDLDTVRPL